MSAVPETSQGDAALSTRGCPFCGERLPSQDSLCSACGKFSKPQDLQPVSRNQAHAPIDQVNQLIAAHGLLSTITSIVITSPFNNSTKSRLGRIVFTVFLICLGLYFIATENGYRGLGGWIAVAMPFLLSAFLYVGSNALTNPSIVGGTDDPAPSGSTFIRYLGYDTDLLALQVVLIASSWVLITNGAVNLAWFASISAATLSIPLFFSKGWAAGAILGVISLCYIVSQGISSGLDYDMEMAQRARLGSRLWEEAQVYMALLAFIAVFPHVSGIEAFSLRLGNLRGDVSFSLFGVKCLLGFTTAGILLAIWLTIDRLF